MIDVYEREMVLLVAKSIETGRDLVEIVIES